MTAGKYDFIVEKGATWSQTLTLYDDEDQLIDLTGYSSKMDIRSSQAASSTILSLASGGALTLGGSAGTIAIAVAASSTSTISADIGVYDLEITDASSVTTRLLEGSVIFKDEVTR